MNILNVAWAGLLTLALTGGAATAADLPARMPVKAPVMAPGYNWIGFYIGGHVGGAWGKDDLTLTGFPALPAGVASAFSFDQSGVIAGIQWGTNYQFGRWVLGTESDISFIDFDKTQTLIVGGANNIATQEFEYFSTTRGRVGYAFDNVLLYGTAGLASARIETTYFQNVGPFVGSRSKTRYGWTAGAGVEWGWGPWSAKLEYLHYDLGDHSFPIVNAAFTPVALAQSDNSGDIVRAGLNYRFNWTPWQLLTGRR